MGVRLQADRAIVLAPHTDDGELGCGGTIGRLLEEGVEVVYVAFSSCRKSVPAGLHPDTLVDEVRAATQRLGIPRANLIVLDFEVRQFDKCRQEILEIMVQLKGRIRPDLVLMPCLQDIHQDHVVIATEGLRAFKHATIMSYELPWNNLSFSTQCFVALDERHLRRKVWALESYGSQSHRAYADPEFVQGQARMRGVESGHHFAEAFQIVRLNVPTLGALRTTDEPTVGYRSNLRRTCGSTEFAGSELVAAMVSPQRLRMDAWEQSLSSSANATLNRTGSLLEHNGSH